MEGPSMIKNCFQIVSLNELTLLLPLPLHFLHLGHGSLLLQLQLHDLLLLRTR